MVGMMRANCQDLSGKGIHTVFNVCPGFLLKRKCSVIMWVVAKKYWLILRVGVTFNRLIEPSEMAATLKVCRRKSCDEWFDHAR